MNLLLPLMYKVCKCVASCKFDCILILYKYYEFKSPFNFMVLSSKSTKLHYTTKENSFLNRIIYTENEILHIVYTKYISCMF